MSQENVERLRSLYDDWAKGNLWALRDVADPDTDDRTSSTTAVPPVPPTTGLLSRTNRRGAGPSLKVSDGTRTRDHLDHNQELYQLSYAHQGGRAIIESPGAGRRCGRRVSSA